MVHWCFFFTLTQRKKAYVVTFGAFAKSYAMAETTPWKALPKISLFDGKGVEEWIVEVKEQLKGFCVGKDGANVLFASFFLIGSAYGWRCA